MHYAVLYLGLEGKGGEQLSGGMVEHLSLHTFIHTSIMNSSRSTSKAVQGTYFVGEDVDDVTRAELVYRHLQRQGAAVLHGVVEDGRDLVANAHSPTCSTYIHTYIHHHHHRG
jgi:hypothetical protein